MTPFLVLLAFLVGIGLGIFVYRRDVAEETLCRPQQHIFLTIKGRKYVFMTADLFHELEVPD
jgi:hypothetical protein